MSEVYFIVKMKFDEYGRPLKDSEEYLAVLSDLELKNKAEEIAIIGKRRGIRTKEDVINDASKRVKPTLSEFPAVSI